MAGFSCYARNFARPASGEQAPRSSGGKNAPAHLQSKCLFESDTIPCQQSKIPHPDRLYFCTSAKSLCLAIGSQAAAALRHILAPAHLQAKCLLRIKQPPRPNKSKTHRPQFGGGAFCWLGWLDSNQRKCQSQSLVPYRLATSQYGVHLVHPHIIT